MGDREGEIPTDTERERERDRERMRKRQKESDNAARMSSLLKHVYWYHPP